MIHKIINRLSLTIQQLSGDKPFTIKLVNAYVELLRNTKSRDYSYNKDEWNNETKKNQIFKSSYKEDETVKDSYFDYLVKRKL